MATVNWDKTKWCDINTNFRVCWASTKTSKEKGMAFFSEREFPFMDFYLLLSHLFIWGFFTKKEQEDKFWFPDLKPGSCSPASVEIVNIVVRKKNTSRDAAESLLLRWGDMIKSDFLVRASPEPSINENSLLTMFGQTTHALNSIMQQQLLSMQLALTKSMKAFNVRLSMVEEGLKGLHAMGAVATPVSGVKRKKLASMEVGGEEGEPGALFSRSSYRYRLSSLRSR